MARTNILSNENALYNWVQVIVKKMGQNAMLIVDESEPMAIISIDEPRFLDLSGKFYLGSLPQNLSLYVHLI